MGFCNVSLFSPELHIWYGIDDEGEKSPSKRRLLPGALTSFIFLYRWCPNLHVEDIRTYVSLYSGPTSAMGDLVLTPHGLSWDVTLCPKGAVFCGQSCVGLLQVMHSWPAFYKLLECQKYIFVDYEQYAFFSWIAKTVKHWKAVCKQVFCIFIVCFSSFLFLF